MWSSDTDVPVGVREIRNWAASLATLSGSDAFQLLDAAGRAQQGDEVTARGRPPRADVVRVEAVLLCVGLQPADGRLVVPIWAGKKASWLRRYHGVALGHQRQGPAPVFVALLPAAAVWTQTMTGRGLLAFQGR